MSEYSASTYRSTPANDAQLRATIAAVLVLLATSFAPCRASAQEFGGILAGCWLATDDSGQQLMLDPGGSFMMRGEVGTWTARHNSIVFQVTRDLRETWDLVLHEDLLTLSSPRERRRTAGGDLESPPDRDRRMEMRRVGFAECGRVPTYPAPEETEPPLEFVPTQPSIVLTNRLRNDPIEVRLANPESPVVCEILSQVCQPVGADGLVFTADDAGLIPTEFGSRTAGAIRIWRVAGGDISRGDLVRPSGQPCLPEDELACAASQGYIILVLDASNAPVTGWIVLGSPREPSVDQAILTPSIGEVPPVLWVETERVVRERGESFWQGFSLGFDDEILRLIAVAGTFNTGAQIVVSREPADGGQTEVCFEVTRSSPTFDATSGDVHLVTEIEAASTEAYSLELKWSSEVSRYVAATLEPGETPPVERTCELQ